VIVVVFADNSYYDAWKYIPVLTFSVAMQLMSGNVGGVFAAEKKSKYFFYSSIWGAGASLVATFICISFWGIQGAAIAVAISCAVTCVSRIIYAWKHINTMPLTWYTVITLICILFIVVVLFDAPLYYNIPLYFIMLAVICWFSRDVVIPVWETARNIIKRKQIK